MLFAIAAVLVIVFIGGPAYRDMKARPWMVIVYLPIATLLMVFSIATAWVAMKQTGMDVQLAKFFEDVFDFIWSFFGGR